MDSKDWSVLINWSETFCTVLIFLSQRTIGPVNAHLTSGQGISTISKFEFGFDHI